MVLSRGHDPEDSVLLDKTLTEYRGQSRSGNFWPLSTGPLHLGMRYTRRDRSSRHDRLERRSSNAKPHFGRLETAATIAKPTFVG
jgi:hypothetical protein